MGKSPIFALIALVVTNIYLLLVSRERPPNAEEDGARTKSGPDQGAGGR
jgi:hypothetical protein